MKSATEQEPDFLYRAAAPRAARVAAVLLSIVLIYLALLLPMAGALITYVRVVFLCLVAGNLLFAYVVRTDFYEDHFYHRDYFLRSNTYLYRDVERFSARSDGLTIFVTNGVQVRVPRSNGNAQAIMRIIQDHIEKTIDGFVSDSISIR